MYDVVWAIITALLFLVLHCIKRRNSDSNTREPDPTTMTVESDQVLSAVHKSHMPGSRSLLEEEEFTFSRRRRRGSDPSIRSSREDDSVTPANTLRLTRSQTHLAPTSISHVLPLPRRRAPLAPLEEEGAPLPVNRRTSRYGFTDVFGFVNKRRLCCAIFKNPCNQRTHFYRYRDKVGVGTGDSSSAVACPGEMRNVAAILRLWGKHWQDIRHVNLICQNLPTAADLTEGMSVWFSRLEKQVEDCQNKYGCSITLQNFDSVSNIERKTFKDLSTKILETCLSEDDLTYFNGQDDSSLLSKVQFEL